MKTVIIVCEGQTEQVFCKEVLAPYLVHHDIFVEAPTIKQTRGGITSWDKLKKQIENHLRDSRNPIVSTLIDYYGLGKKHNFPNWDESLNIADKKKRMDCLEEAMKNDVTQILQDRFLPYIQLHEFEALLFIDIHIFHQNFTTQELVGIQELQTIFRDYDNPEMINNGKSTSPSHRLERMISGYKKTTNGIEIAEKIGIDNMRAKTPRFNEWIDKIIRHP